MSLHGSSRAACGGLGRTVQGFFWMDLLVFFLASFGFLGGLGWFSPSFLEVFFDGFEGARMFYRFFIDCVWGFGDPAGFHGGLVLSGG